MPIQVLSNNTELTDVAIGDSYPILVSGSLFESDQITSVLVMVKANETDADSAALISLTITATQTVHGQILVNGTSGTYQVQINLLPADTAKLTPNQPNGTFAGFWEVRLVAVDGSEWSPVLNDSIAASPRLIQAS